LKNLIKVHTAKDQAQAIAIPGHADTSLARFEESFFNELSNQHDRVDLFVRSKADEITRRLRTFLDPSSPPPPPRKYKLTSAQSSFRKLSSV
jgi:hypothetical protein